MESIGDLAGLAEEYYNGRNVIRVYNHEANSLEKIEQSAEKARIANQRVDFFSNCVNPLIRLPTRVSHAAIALIAGRAGRRRENLRTFGRAGGGRQSICAY